MLLWEVNRIKRALRGAGVEVILLKGAAYAVAELPPADGRFVSDVDIMVRYGALPFAEAALIAHGWERVVSSAYDQHYYRQWMHELPPLRHRERLTLVDVHHALLPRTSRLHFDVAPMWDSAIASPVDGFRILAPVDMVLHSAVHLFHDGDLDHGLRDLVDLHELFTHFGAEHGFWADLLARTQQLGLGRTLYYATCFGQQCLGTRIPESVSTHLLAYAPVAPLRWLMSTLMTRRFSPIEPGRASLWAGFASWCLYVRSHYLRMPLRLLIPHLLHKARRARVSRG